MKSQYCSSLDRQYKHPFEIRGCHLIYCSLKTSLIEIDSEAQLQFQLVFTDSESKTEQVEEKLLKYFWGY